MSNCPRPGSDAAVRRGCTCPAIPIRVGAGYRWKQSVGHGKDELFLVANACPLHGAGAKPVRTFGHEPSPVQDPIFSPGFPEDVRKALGELFGWHDAPPG